MTRESDRLLIDAMVSEDAAHRVLARAVELDARFANQLSIDQLREVAREAGIAPAAFDAALSEFQLEQARASEPESGFFRKLWRSNKGSKWRGLTANLAAFALFIVLISAAGRTNRALDWSWQTYHGVQLLVTALVAGFSVKQRARIAALFFGTTAAAQLARYVMHLLFGIQTVQGGPTQWGLILASLLGIGFGAVLLRARRPSVDVPPNAMANDASDAETPVDSGSERRPPASLLLRPA